MPSSILNPPSSLQVPLALETGDASILVGVDFVRALRRCDAQSVFARVDNGAHPQHLRFAFNLSCSSGRQSAPTDSARFLRFWTTEILAPDSVKNFDLEEALAAIVGARETFPRGFLESQWVISAQHITHLVAAGALTETGHRFLNSSLKNFLRRRWIGAPLALPAGEGRGEGEPI